MFATLALPFLTLLMGRVGAELAALCVGRGKGSDRDLHRCEEGHLPQVAKAGLPGCHLSKCCVLHCCGLPVVEPLLKQGGTRQVLHFPAVPAELSAGRRGAGGVPAEQ